MTLRRAVLWAFVGVVGCAGETTSSSDPNLIAGQWSYRGVQTSTMPMTSEGTMEVTGALAGELGGTFRGTERDQTGVSEVVEAAVAGRLVAGRTIDMTLLWQGVARRHIGTLRGDSITGAWSTETPPITAGTFTMARQ